MRLPPSAPWPAKDCALSLLAAATAHKPGSKFKASALTGDPELPGKPGPSPAAHTTGLARSWQDTQFVPVASLRVVRGQHTRGKSGTCGQSTGTCLGQSWYLHLQPHGPNLAWCTVGCYSSNEQSLRGLRERMICPMFGPML